MEEGEKFRAKNSKAGPGRNTERDAVLAGGVHGQGGKAGGKEGREEGSQDGPFPGEAKVGPQDPQHVGRRGEGEGGGEPEVLSCG